VIRLNKRRESELGLKIVNFENVEKICGAGKPNGKRRKKNQGVRSS